MIDSCGDNQGGQAKVTTASKKWRNRPNGAGGRWGIGREKKKRLKRANDYQQLNLGPFFTSAFFVSTRKTGSEKQVRAEKHVPVFPSQEIVTNFEKTGCR